MKQQAKKWLDFSDVDLLSANELLHDERLTQSVAFHCHQAIEKCFKALLEELGNDVPRTHDLIRLYGTIFEQGIKIELDEDILDQINDVYIDSRYPADTGLIPQGKPSKNKVKIFYNLAQQVCDAIRTKLIK